MTTVARIALDAPTSIGASLRAMTRAAIRGTVLASIVGCAPALGAGQEEPVDPVSAVPVDAASASIVLRADRAPVPVVLDNIGALLGLSVVIEGDPRELFSGTLQGSLGDALTELQAAEPMLFDVHADVLSVMPLASANTERLANNAAGVLPLASVLSLASGLPGNRIQSDASGTVVSGHPAFVTRTTAALRALLSMRGLGSEDDGDRTQAGSPSASRDRAGGPLSGLEDIPGFNTL